MAGVAIGSPERRTRRRGPAALHSAQRGPKLSWGGPAFGYNRESKFESARRGVRRTRGSPAALAGGVCKMRNRSLVLRRAVAALLWLPLACAAWGQLRVATWNISNYAGGATADVQNVVYAVFNGRSMSPDIILTQEFLSVTAVNNFRT